MAIKRNTEPSESEDSLELAKDAINYVLGRIAEDENIRYHMGAFTEAFARLKRAHSALNGITEEAIEEDVFSRRLRVPYAHIVAGIKEITREGGYDFEEKLRRIADLVDKS